MFLIRGGHRLTGTIKCPASKNAALAILSAALLVDGILELEDLPQISDVRVKLAMLRDFGATVEVEGNIVRIDCRSLTWKGANSDRFQAIRTGFYLIGPMLGRFGQAEIPLPGGCNIGVRPVDYHLEGLKRMHAEVWIDRDRGVYRAEAQGLSAAEIQLPFPSAGATQHLMTTAIMAKGITTIRNAAIEPEVVQLADFLKSCGAKIVGAGTSTVEITGTGLLRGSRHRVPADRIQAATYLIAGAITKGDVKVTGLVPDDSASVVDALRQAGVNIEADGESIRAWIDRAPEALPELRTMPHPGFPTDVQQPFGALMCLAHGTTNVVETIYERRHGHVAELDRK
ncbi:MAG: UDP-N-acetylglucosamine 1-carboxyvinyltransferase, partial [Fimbriimonadaceae bacterium]|nr:UDP-N-acetylglucosamine 1-carboxyvinyltransferase [Fimbriimonadaceae bacterium]